jgi:hypothetical protein
MRNPIIITQEERPIMVEALKALNLPCSHEFTKEPGQYPAKLGDKPEEFICDCLKLRFEDTPTEETIEALHQRFDIWDWNDKVVLLRRPKNT